MFVVMGTSEDVTLDISDENSADRRILGQQGAPLRFGVQNRPRTVTGHYPPIRAAINVLRTTLSLFTRFNASNILRK